MKFTVVAYAESGLPRKEATITARDQDEAWSKAWRTFPEYHEVGVFEICPEGINVTASGPDRNAEFQAFKKNA
jgi:hypothetical protein